MDELAKALKERLYKAVGQFRRETGELPTNFEAVVVVDENGDFYVRSPLPPVQAASNAKTAALPPKKSASDEDNSL